MSKTLKQKVRHIFYDKDGNLNLRVPSEEQRIAVAARPQHM